MQTGLRRAHDPAAALPFIVPFRRGYRLDPSDALPAMTYITRRLSHRSILLRSPRDLASALLLTAIALSGLWFGRDWETGTLASVQAGFFPRLICLALLALGVLILVQALRRHAATPSRWSWRPSLAITVAVLAFAAVLNQVGLVLALLALVGIGGLAGQPLPPVRLATLWATLATACIAIFSWGLGLPLPIWP